MIFGIRKRVLGLSCGVVCVILRLAVLIQYRSVTDTHTDTRRRNIPRLARRRAVKKSAFFQTNLLCHAAIRKRRPIAQFWWYFIQKPQSTFAAMWQKLAHYATYLRMSILTYFTGLLGVLVAMIIKIYVWRSPKGRLVTYVAMATS